MPSRGSATFDSNAGLSSSKAHRTSSLGTMEERMKAEAAAATARALVGMETEGGDPGEGGAPPLLNFPCVAGDAEETLAQVAQRDVLNEIIKVREASGGRAESRLFNPVRVLGVSKVESSRGVEVEKKKVSRPASEASATGRNR
jgi:hypothetical protein